MSGAARVFITLDELAEMLRLPQGHRLEAAEELPDGYRLGLALTIVSDSPPLLPKCNATEPVIALELATYRQWVGGLQPMARPTRTVLREVEDRQNEMLRYANQAKPQAPAYTPARPPVDPVPNRPGAAAAGGDIVLKVPPPEHREWPSFPGERLSYIGEQDDPGDETGHQGGPR